MAESSQKWRKTAIFCISFALSALRIAGKSRVFIAVKKFYLPPENA
jgi:hypothetical protein